MGSKKECMFFKWVVKRTHVFEMGSKKDRMFLKWVVAFEKHALFCAPPCTAVRLQNLNHIAAEI
jgi:hypothetical protein